MSQVYNKHQLLTLIWSRRAVAILVCISNSLFFSKSSGNELTAFVNLFVLSAKRSIVSSEVGSNPY